MEKLINPDDEYWRMMVEIPDYEIMAVRDGMRSRHLYILKRIQRALHTERTRPWREVLGTDRE